MPNLLAVPSYGFCRGLAGHRWPIDAPMTIDEDKRLVIDLRCDNCSTVRRDKINPRNGELDARHYVYPTNYQFKGMGDNRPSRDQIRQEYLGYLIRRTKNTK